MGEVYVCIIKERGRTIIIACYKETAKLLF